MINSFQKQNQTVEWRDPFEGVVIG